MKTVKTSRTRQHIVDTARILFAKKGKFATSMGDIAISSEIGRRTLYTYFSNKDEVYLAVIENELNHLIERLQVVMEKKTTPAQKLEEYIFTRFEAIKEAVERNGSLKADFFRNIYEVEKARRPIDIKEIRMLKEILTDGIIDGSFSITQPQWAAVMMLYSLKGIEAPYLKNNIGDYIRTHRKNIINTIFNGLLSNQQK